MKNRREAVIAFILCGNLSVILPPPLSQYVSKPGVAELLEAIGFELQVCMLLYAELSMYYYEGAVFINKLRRTQQCDIVVVYRIPLD